MRMILSLLLTKSGFEVVQAKSGEQACKLYRANHLVVADVSLPGLDGPSTIARLRERDPQVRFCFITGSDPQELRDRGAAYVFQKPFPLDDFVQALRQLAASLPADTPSR